MSEYFNPYSYINHSEVGNRMWSPMTTTDSPCQGETQIEKFGAMSGWQHPTNPALVMLHERLHKKTMPLNCPCNQVKEGFEMPDGYVPNDYMHHEIYQQPVSPYCPNNIRPIDGMLDELYRYSYQDAYDGQTDGLMRDLENQRRAGMAMMAMPAQKSEKHHYLLLLCILVLIIVLMTQ